jgi:hypothetical protein
MNEIFGLCEDNAIQIIYQDTDSLRLPYEKVGLLDKLFREKYQRNLIGKHLGQFHSDYPEISNRFETYGVNSWYVGKKAYMDKVSNDNGDTTFVCRMKGIRQDVLSIISNLLYSKVDSIEFRNGLFYPRFGIGKSSIEQLFDDLYEGKAIEFDLCLSSSPSFDLHSNFSIETKTSFVRKIQCS